MDRAAEEVRGAWEGRQGDEKGGGRQGNERMERGEREEEREDGGPEEGRGGVSHPVCVSLGFFKSNERLKGRQEGDRRGRSANTQEVKEKEKMSATNEV